MTDQVSLSPEELAWAQLNADKIRAMMKTTVENVAESVDEALLDPIDSAARDLRISIRKKIVSLEKKIRSHQAMVDKRLDWLTNLTSDDNRREYQADVEKFRGEIESWQRVKAILEAKIERLETDPASMFLPIGAIVRFTDAVTYDNPDSMTDANLMYPVAGSVGMVTGLHHTGEYPIAVSLRRPFKTGYGDEIQPEYDCSPTYRIDPDKVEIIGYGVLPNGEPCKSYGYLPTHSRTPSYAGDERSDEMVIEADGFFWRLHDFGGTQSIELLQCYERIEDMTWINGPLQQYAASSLTP